LLITETDPLPIRFSESGIEEFLADGIIVLYNASQSQGRINAIEVLKMRYGQHLKRIVEMEITKPLNEVRNRVNEELAKLESREALVPIDRDPVPSRYAELVRIYYENLGGGD